MAYSIICGLPPIYGLYVSMFPAIVYFIFGTSHHLSIGTFAITSLMTHSSLEKFEAFLSNNNNNNSHQSISTSNDSVSEMNQNFSTTSFSFTTINNNESLTYFTSNQSMNNINMNETKIIIATSLTFLIGLFQVGKSKNSFHFLQKKKFSPFLNILKILFGILHLGFISKYLSDEIVTGFTTGNLKLYLLFQLNFN